MNWYLAKLGSLDEKRACPSHPQNLQNPFKRGFDGFEGWCDDPYASGLAALRATCPAYVPEDWWRQAISDATSFVCAWGGQAQALGQDRLLKCLRQRRTTLFRQQRFESFAGTSPP
jgi:hypothetical protein